MQSAALEQPPAVAGPVRLGRKTKMLVKRLRAGEVAVIDHHNLDRVSAEDLITIGAAAVLNCRPSSSGEYPNMGPLLLVQAGIPLVDLPDDAVFRALKDGDPVEVRGGTILVHGKVVAEGRLQEPADVLAATERRRLEIGGALEAFARNTVEHMVDEQDLLSGKIELPRFETDFRDRPALIVVRGVNHQADLQALRPVHPRRAAGARRRRRRRERDPRGGLSPGHDRRRHGLGLGRDAALRRRARRARLPRRPRARDATICRGSGWHTRSSRRPGPARTSPC